MGSDAIANARVSAINNKSANNSRGSKLAKLKPNKVEFRTEHGLPQVNKMEYNGKNHNVGGERPPSIPKGRKGNRTQGGNQSINAGKHEHEPILPIPCNNEAVSWTNGGSVVRRLNRDSLSRDLYGNIVNSCSGSCSSSCSEDDGCLDDWEAMADALNAENNRQHSDLEHHTSKPEASAANHRYQGPNRAWSPDDAYRPRSLPRISKQQYNQSQPNSRRYNSRGYAAFSWQTVKPRQQQHQPRQQQHQQQWQQQQQQQWQQQQQQQLPSACPICCEDFDVTDSSFQPCPCGFRLCLFCHNKILEVDGRCPGCRKKYGSASADVDLPAQTTSYTKNSWV